MANRFEELHPWSVFAYLLGVLIFIITSEQDAIMIFWFGVLAVNDVAMFGAGKFLKALRYYVVMIVAMAVFQVIFNHSGETVFLYVNDQPWTLEAFLYGMHMGFMVSALFLWFRLFQCLLDNRKITYMLGKRFPTIALIVSMVFCYYEKFLHKIDKIQEVWSTYGTEKKFGKMKHAGILLSVLLTVMLEDSVDTAMSMTARAYGAGKRTDYMQYPWELRDLLLLLVTILTGAVYVIGKEKLIVLCMLFVIIPTIYNIYKEIQWKYYLSKI